MLKRSLEKEKKEGRDDQRNNARAQAGEELKDYTSGNFINTLIVTVLADELRF